MCRLPQKSKGVGSPGAMGSCAPPNILQGRELRCEWSLLLATEPTPVPKTCIILEAGIRISVREGGRENHFLLQEITESATWR